MKHGQPHAPYRARIAHLALASALATLLHAGGALADGHVATVDSMPKPSEDAAPQAPPGAIVSEGVVPADEHAGEEVSREPIGHVPGPGEGVYGDPPNSGVGHPEDRPWAYDTRYFFALTRELPTATDLSENGRRWVSAVTIPLDVLTLPTAALAGLSGRSPEAETVQHADASAPPQPAADAPENESPEGVVPEEPAAS